MNASARAGIHRFADLWLIPVSERGRRCIVVIELHKPHNVYMDESRQDRYEVPIYSVSGYVSTFEAFCALENEWKATLKHWGISDFHANEFIARQKEFKNNWTDETTR
jgi:hypothetical protein